MKSRSCFTLIELMVTIAIVAILGGITLALVGRSSEKNTEALTQTKMQELVNALEKYKAKYGYYPVVTCPAPPPTAGDNPSGPYEVNFTRDEWKKFRQGNFLPAAADVNEWIDGSEQPFYYICPGRHNKKSYDLWSKGADEEHGVAGEDGKWYEKAGNGDDISNWKAN